MGETESPGIEVPESKDQAAPQLEPTSEAPKQSNFKKLLSMMHIGVRDIKVKPVVHKVDRQQVKQNMQQEPEASS